MNFLRVLNLGAGVQSTAIYLMMIDGELEPADIAIFADVQEEPASVYEHLERLTHQDESAGIGRRQCTAEYKIAPIEREIRRRMDAVGKPLKADQNVVQVFGLSFDEPRRVDRVKAQFAGRRGWSCEFPLFDDFMTRADCVRYLEKRWQHPVPRSACVFCPYHSDTEWQRIKTEDPEGWRRAIEIDEAIRKPTSVCTRGMNATQYLHKSCKPLSEVELKPAADDKQKLFDWSQMDCEGMCGV